MGSVQQQLEPPEPTDTGGVAALAVDQNEAFM
jgi:hypothetical protein